MERPKKVALLVTCLVDQVLPEVGVATVRLLRRAGFEVDFPQAQTCCGQPFFNSGFQDQARELARRTVEIFEPYEAVVLPSGSCATMIRTEYEHLLAPLPGFEVRVRALAAKTYELTHFLTRFAPDFVGAAGDRGSITYHDSCHMCRTLGLQDEPREQLRAAGFSISEMEESDRCCGFGGVFSIRMPEVSNAMTAEKLHQAAATGVEVLATADPGCMMQMRGLVGDELRIEHVATLLEEATR